MTTRDRINEYFNGRQFVMLCALALVVVTWASFSAGKIGGEQAVGHGFLFSLDAPAFTHAGLSAVLQVLCVLVIGLVLMAAGKLFSFVRSVTNLYVSSFFLLQLANPLTGFNAGTLLCLVVALSLLPLFFSYQDHHAQRSIFLIFAIAATGSLFHYAFLLLMVVMLLGFAYMRSLNFKGLLAALLGVVTPFWIVLGLGLARPADFCLPQLSLPQLALPDLPASLHLALAVATGVLGIVLVAHNLVRLLSYRLQTRVYNAFFVLTLLLTLLAMIIDCGDLTVFLPLLNLTVAVQIAHAYTLSSFKYRYLLIFLLIAGCLGFAVGNLLT